MARVCPRCSDVLEEKRFGDIPLDGCRSCGGIWFDCQELNTLVRDPQSALMEIERAFNAAIFGGGTQGAMLCPRCEQPLCPFTFAHTPGVELDVCRKCKGIWLDDGELQKITERIAGTRPQPQVERSELPELRDHGRSITGFLLSAPCPACKTTNPAACTACWACGKPLKAGVVHHLCPRCDRPLRETEGAGSTVVEACLHCAGVWFEAGELSVLLQSGQGVVRDLEQKLAISRIGNAEQCQTTFNAKCPGCQFQMERKAFGSMQALIVDTCTYCNSVWLDSGELTSAYQFMEQGFTIQSASTETDPWGDG